jgi:cysteinyl-tRNA synthetase
MKHKLKLYNTLSKRKEALRPLKNGIIKIFVCGPTVHDYPHIGNARTCIVFDCLVKYLRHLGFRVFYLQNITDIDDKIIANARSKGVSPKNLAEIFEKEYLKNMKSIGVDSVSKYAKATNYIKEIISQVKRLLESGYAYKINDGIYYDISKFKNYGKLSGRTALQAEDSVSRIDYSVNKKNRGDFCLWKFSVDNEPSWPSSLGNGRPGWHIEDTAITEKFFGAQYDIHGGGIDLVFPHHEAEIAQMESISGKKPLARYWIHSGFLTINGQKMSKSLNNFIKIDDFLKNHSHRHLRFWMAKNLWHSPLDYSESSMIEVKSSLERIEEFLRRVRNINSFHNKLKTTNLKKIKKIILFSREEFYKNLSNNFNTPKAFAAIFYLIKEINKFLDVNAISEKQSDEIYNFFQEINKIFGIIDFKNLKQSNVPKEIKDLLWKRENLRKSGDWESADKLRIEIEKYGYIIDDTKEGPLLRRF